MSAWSVRPDGLWTIHGRGVAIGVVIVLAVAACTRGSTATPSRTQESTASTHASTTTSSTEPLPPTAPALVPETIASWKIIGEAPSHPATPDAIFCVSPDPPALCDHLDGPVDLGGYGTGDETLGVTVHLSPVSFTDAQVATNLATATNSCSCRTVETTTADGRPAWVVQGSTRGGGFVFLVTRLSDTAYASVLQYCGFGPCPSPFPLDHARQLVAELAPTRITMQLLRWLGPANATSRRLRVPFGDRACDLGGPQRTDSTAAYSIAEHVAVPVAPGPISDFSQLCANTSFG